MIGYIIRRLVIAVIVTIGIAAITFAGLHYLQPSPASTVLGTKAQPIAIAVWNKQHGYDRSEAAQFVSYLGHLAHGRLRVLLQAQPERRGAVQGERSAAASTCPPRR